MNKLINWIVKEDYDEDEEVMNNVTIKDYTINDFNKIEEIGINMKHQEIILCRLNSDIFTRAMDYLSGIAFILEYTTIPIHKHIYLFILHTIQYSSNSQRISFTRYKS